MQAGSTTLIYELLTPDSVRVGLAADDKTDVLNAVVDMLAGHPAVSDLEGVREAVFQREAVMSTGVGKGLALPHAKTPAVTSTVAAFATLSKPVPFDAIDDEPVQLVFLLLGTEEARSLHIKILSRISRLMNRGPLRDKLLRADSAANVLSIFQEGDAISDR